MRTDYTNFDKAVDSLGCGCLCNEPMSRHTTFRIGGEADRFVTVQTVKQLAGLLSVLEADGIPRFVLGNGSNLLVSDKGIRGVVIKLDGDFKKLELLPDGRTIRAGAAVSLASACALARDNSLSGLEFAWGIPGFVGGAVYMNAGAYGGELKDVATKIIHMLPNGETATVSGEEAAFAYRRSRYTGGRDIILSAELTLAPGDPSAIAAEMDELMTRRKDKQPYEMPSAGSVFKRPQNGFAAALIEECGLKGRTVGGAQVSPKHSGFIVNIGGATCADVLELIEIIKREVLEKTGTELECEVRVTGEPQ